MRTFRLSSSSWSGRSAIAGLVLLEVLLSVSIIAIGLGTLMKTISASARMQSHIEERAVAQRLAETKVVELRMQRYADWNEERSGRFAVPFEEYTWRARAETSPSDASFHSVALTIWNNSEDEPRQVFRLVTLLNQG